MTFEEAKNLLLLHSLSHSDLNNPLMEQGFLGSLRPYKGLQPENFHQIMTAISTLAPHLQQKEYLDKAIISALWGICHYARAWGIHPDGMLRRNNLISDEDVARLEIWLEVISDTVSLLLEGYDLDEALLSYKSITSDEKG
jgi:hypothetical protein